jgi:SAM-dependent methyltransferase
VIDRRLLAGALAAVAFGAGWVTHARLSREPERPPPPGVEAVVAPLPATVGPTTSVSTQEVFDDIYRRGLWGRNAESVGHSGVGSELSTTALYRAFLEQFMKNAGIHSVVDAGCGDWEFSQAIDWKDIDYKGYDIVESVIEGDRKKYGKPGVQFFVANVVDADLPPADLLICKHVLQHLPSADVLKFLQQLPKYKHVLLVDSVSSVTLSAPNRDIAAGAFRELDVTQPPFNVHGSKVLTYWDGWNMQQVVYVPRRS